MPSFSHKFVENPSDFDIFARNTTEAIQDIEDMDEDQPLSPVSFDDATLRAGISR